MNRTHRGLTLIELLVAMAVLLTILALVVPRLRILSDDQRIHEAARSVASSVSKAANRSLDLGDRQEKSTNTVRHSKLSGAFVLIERNHKFEHEGIFYAANRIRQGRLRFENYQQKEWQFAWHEIPTFVRRREFGLWDPPINVNMPRGTEVSRDGHNFEFVKLLYSS